MSLWNWDWAETPGPSLPTSDAMGEGGDEIMSADAQPLRRRSLCNLLERPLPPAISAHTISAFLIWLPPQTIVCAFLPNFHELPLHSSRALGFSLGTRCMSDHMRQNLNSYGLYQLFILQITVIKGVGCVRGMFHFIFSFLCLPSLCLDIGIWGGRKKEGFLGKSCSTTVGSTVM